MSEQDFPEELRGMDESEAEQRAQELQSEAEDAARRLSEEQQQVLESLEEEHGGDRVEVEVTLPGGNDATVRADLNGHLFDRMGHVDEKLSRLEDPEPGDMAGIGEAMDEAAAILADLTVEAKYSKEVFYQIYQQYGPEALGRHVEAAFEAIKRERKRKAGEIDGFRETE